MALAGESAGTLAEGQVQPGDKIQIEVLDPTDERVKAIASDPQNPTMPELIWFRRGYVITRSDGLPGGMRWTDWANMDDGSGGLTTGDGAAMRPILKRAHDDGKVVLGL